MSADCAPHDKSVGRAGVWVGAEDPAASAPCGYAGSRIADDSQRKTALIIVPGFYPGDAPNPLTDTRIGNELLAKQHDLADDLVVEIACQGMQQQDVKVEPRWLTRHGPVQDERRLRPKQNESFSLRRPSSAQGHSRTLA